jgi:long-subunit acyl-CoA synthetase (AMP-forming)
MIYLKRIIKSDYKKWYNDPYIYEKVNGKYEYITFGKFFEHVFSIANTLINKKLKNKKIIIYSENSIKLMECDLAISLYVGISAPVSKEWKYDELCDGIEELNASCIIYSNKYKDVIDKIKDKYNIELICMDEIKYHFTKDMLEMNVKPFDKVAKIVFSSGTTGRSKAVQLSLRNIFAGYPSLIRRCPFNHNDSTYLFLPLNHTYASVYNFMYSLLAGYKIYLASSVANIGSELLETNPTIFCAVPLVFNNLLNSYQDKISYAFGTNIKYLFSGGAPMSKETRQKYKDAGLNLMQAYALSETASSLAIAYPYQDDLESVGTIFEDMDVQVYNPDKKGIGEIIVKGEAVFKGYTDNTLNKRVFDEKGYFHSGDTGYIKDGKIYLCGRIKKMLLTSNGENVDPTNIETKIKDMDSHIKDVKAYIKDDKIAINVYVDKTIDIDTIVENYNQDIPRYERVEYYKVYKDSIDTRLKQ